ncbi:HalOD1 output domain-containing protein [Natronococcus wangiae]|uniref:HalOD1 output domain-containing protein n=1 Tax=Natronococcus wangiae TaxID=3068275 RepID=UPI00273D633A|nr:HalOD1 output domain-containing protein [Natronococcus sp. AD5]
MTDSIGSSGGGRSGPSVDVAIVRAVADRQGIEPTELPPLYEWVDPEALQRLFDAPAYGSASERRFVFDYAGHTVTVEHDDELSITVDESATGPTATSDSSDESRSDA